jgi:hypothetical protein
VWDPGFGCYDLLMLDRRDRFTRLYTGVVERIERQAARAAAEVSARCDSASAQFSHQRGGVGRPSDVLVEAARARPPLFGRRAAPVGNSRRRGS